MALLLSCVALQYSSSWALELSYVALLLSCVALQYPSSFDELLGSFAKLRGSSISEHLAPKLSYVALQYPSYVAPELSYVALLYPSSLAPELSYVALLYPSSLAPELSYVALLLICVAFQYPSSQTELRGSFISELLGS